VAARNRRRARERRPQQDGDQSQLATAGDAQTPPPKEATPDAELDNPQVMLGSAGFVRDRDAGSAEYDTVFEDEIPQDAAGDGGTEAATGSELVRPAPAIPERPGTLSRLTNFLRGSWRELQRVQWPDRRQVMQATGVVLGFVFVAAVYLGLADYVSQKVVHFILTK
jgi:preprotein translocase SecE subunit